MTSTLLSRRCFLGATLGLASSGVIPQAKAEIFKDTSGLAAGNFVWQPRLSTSGPVLILISPVEQTLHVYRGRERIGISTCRIGREAAQLPFGVLPLIDQTRRPAQSEAVQRRSWHVAASFADGLQRAPAALPIRIPRDFAGLLAGASEAGGVIVIAPRRTVPALVAHGLGATDEEIAAICTRAARGPETADAMGEEAHVVISSASRSAMLVRAGKVIATTAVSIAEPQRPLGTHFYALQGRAEKTGLHWLGISLAQRTSTAQFPDGGAAAAFNRISFADASEAVALRGALGARAALIITDAAAGPDTRLAAPGFEIFADGDAAAKPAIAATGKRKGRFARKGGARTADGAEARSDAKSFTNPLY